MFINVLRGAAGRMVFVSGGKCEIFAVVSGKVVYARRHEGR